MCYHTWLCVLLCEVVSYEQQEQHSSFSDGVINIWFSNTQLWFWRSSAFGHSAEEKKVAPSQSAYHDHVHAILDCQQQSMENLEVLLAVIFQ